MPKRRYRSFTFKLRGVVWNVKFVSAKYIQKDMNGKECWGRTDYSGHSILIDKDAPHEKVKHIFYHEFGHCCYLSDFGSTNSQRDLINVELSCNLYADGMLELLLQKKSLPRWLWR